MSLARVKQERCLIKPRAWRGSYTLVFQKYRDRWSLVDIRVMTLIFRSASVGESR